MLANAEEHVREVFARVRAADPAVADLYNRDATVTTFEGQRHRGRDAIRDFYRATFARGGQPQVRQLVGEWPLIVAVIDASVGDVSVAAVDLFELDDHGIVSMSAFAQAPLAAE